MDSCFRVWLLVIICLLVRISMVPIFPRLAIEENCNKNGYDLKRKRSLCEPPQGFTEGPELVH